jgi:hypothetical protein
MAAYADATRRGTLLPGLLKGRAREGDASGFKASASGLITRSLLAAHFKDRMKLLGRAYVQLEGTIGSDEDGYAKWLAKAAAECESFGASLPALPTGLKAIRIPGLSLIAGVVLRKSDLLVLQLIGSGLILLSLGFLIFVAAWSSFRQKREIMLPGVRHLNTQERAVQKRHAGFNVYRAEEDLADYLGYGRPREIQLDLLAIVVAAALLLALPLVACVVLDLGTAPLVLSLTMLAGVVLATVRSVSFRWQQRRWR